MTLNEERIKLFLQFVIVAGLTVLIVARFSPQIIGSTETDSRVEGIINNIYEGKLEVRPAIGEPQPLNQSLQGTPSRTSQDAEGNLQQPQSNLQQQDPNQGLQQGATTEQLPDDYQL